MKKIKYLIWCLVVWLWLLFNQSFWLDVEMVSLSWDYNYLVEFPYRYSCRPNSNCYPKYPYLYYTFSYNEWSTNHSLSPYSISFNQLSTIEDKFTFNNTIFWYLPYESSSIYDWYLYQPYNSILNTWSYLEPEFVLWNSWLYWRAFVCFDCLNALDDSVNPKFSLWSNIIYWWNYDLLKWYSYLRLIYNTWIDINSIDLSVYDTWLNKYNIPSFVWHEYFNNYWTRTNYWRIADTHWYTYSRFWLYWFWYSSISNLDNSNTWQITWWNLTFKTIYDSIIDQLESMWNDPNKWILIDSDLSWYSYDWVLVLPWNSYYSWSYEWQYLIAKDPNNLTRILYEVYSCANSNIDILFSWENWCYKLDAWYLTYNWSTFLMNFPNYWISANINDSNYPFLSDITQFRWQVIEKWYNLIQIWSHTYWLQTDYNVSIKDSLNTFNPESSQDYLTKCITDSEFYQQNESFCKVISSAVESWIPTEIPWTDDQYLVVSYDENWNPIYWVTIQEDLVQQKSWYEWQLDSSWNRYLSCVSESCNPYYNSWITVWYNSLTNWFSDFFEQWMFFRCPFNYDYLKSLQLWSSLVAEIWNKILFPINCMIAWYQNWSNFNILWSWWLVLESRLFNSDDYKGLYNFFDIVLSLWILFFIFKIYNLIK